MKIINGFNKIIESFFQCSYLMSCYQHSQISLVFDSEATCHCFMMTKVFILKLFILSVVINLCFAGIKDWIEEMSSWPVQTVSSCSKGKSKKLKKPKVIAIHVPKIKYVPIRVLPAMPASKLKVAHHVQADPMSVEVEQEPEPWQSMQQMQGGGWD